MKLCFMVFLGEFYECTWFAFIKAYFISKEGWDEHLIIVCRDDTRIGDVC